MEISQTCFPLRQVSRFGMTRTLVHCEHPALSFLLRLALSLTVQSLLALLACCLGEGRNWSQRQLHPKEQRRETEHWLGCQTVLGLKSGFCIYQLGDLGQNHDRQCLSSPFLLCQWNSKFAQVSVPMISGEPGPDLTVNKWSVLANEMKRECAGDSSGIFTPWYEKAGKEYLSILSDTYFLLDVKLAGGRDLPVHTALLVPTVEIHWLMMWLWQTFYDQEAKKMWRHLFGVLPPKSRLPRWC